MKKLLITGGAGYVGSHVSKLFLEKGFSVDVVDNLTTGKRGAVEALKEFGSVTLYEVDIRDKEKLDKVFKESMPDLVVHLASPSSPHESVGDPYKYFDNGVVGSLNVLECMRNNGVDKIVYSSTCSVYGESEYLPVDEKHPTKPSSPYGEGKVMVEKMNKWFKEAFGIRYINFRFFNVCGADEDSIIGDSKNPSVHLMQNIVRATLGIEELKLTCPKVDTPDGTPIRDFVDVRDIARAVYLAYEYLERNEEGHTLNLGSGKGYSVLEIISAVGKILRVDVEGFKAESTRKGEYAAVYASYDKAKEVIGWEPQKTLYESVETTFNWYKKHPHGFKF